MLSASQSKYSFFSSRRNASTARTDVPPSFGGSPGYELLPDVLADPGHKQHNELRDWLRGRLDRAESDPAVTNARCKRSIIVSSALALASVRPMHRRQRGCAHPPRVQVTVVLGR
jgi:hypothetical protein